MPRGFNIITLYFEHTHGTPHTTHTHTPYTPHTHHIHTTHTHTYTHTQLSTSPLPHALYIPHSFHPTCFHHPNHIWYAVEGHVAHHYEVFFRHLKLTGNVFRETKSVVWSCDCNVEDRWLTASRRLSRSEGLKAAPCPMLFTHNYDVTARKEEANKCQFVSTPLCCVIHFLFHGIKGFGNVPEAGRQAGRQAGHCPAEHGGEYRGRWKQILLCFLCLLVIEES